MSDGSCCLMLQEPSEPGDVREEKSRLHALGYVDSHQGTQSLMIKFFLQPGMYSDEPSRRRLGVS